MTRQLSARRLSKPGGIAGSALRSVPDCRLPIGAAGCADWRVGVVLMLKLDDGLVAALSPLHLDKDAAAQGCGWQFPSDHPDSFRGKGIKRLGLKVWFNASDDSLAARMPAINHRAQSGFVIGGKDRVEFIDSESRPPKINGAVERGLANLDGRDTPWREERITLNSVVFPLSGSAELMLRIGLCVATSSCTQASMIHSADRDRVLSAHVTCLRMRAMMSRSNASPSTTSGHGSTPNEDTAAQFPRLPDRSGAPRLRRQWRCG